MFKKFLDKNRHFVPLSTTFGIVASIGIILMSPPNMDVDAEEARQAKMLSDYDRNYITLHPVEWNGDGDRHYLPDVPYQYYAGFAKGFCHYIVPLVTIQQSELPQTYTLSKSQSEIEARERLTKYSGYITQHPNGIQVVNNELQNMMQNGFLYNRAFSLASTFSCNAGEGLKSFMVGNQSFSFEQLEQALLGSFNNILTTIEQSRDLTSDENYEVIMNEAFGAEAERLYREYDKQKDKPIIQFALKL